MAGNRRKFHRSSILSHSHPQTPENISRSPRSEETITPVSRGFGTPTTENAETQRTDYSPLSWAAVKKSHFNPTSSKTPICDALIRHGIFPDRGRTKQWPQEPESDQPAWRTPCGMNGIHDAVNLIRFKRLRIRGNETATPQPEQREEIMSVQTLSHHISTPQCTLSDRQLICLQEWNRLHCKWTPLLYEQSLFPASLRWKFRELYLAAVTSILQGEHGETAYEMI